MKMLVITLLSLMTISLPAYGQNEAPETVTLTNPLIADISQDVIEIRSDFNGAQLLIFGARNTPGDIAIVIRGPEVKTSLRRKERIAGMWMHVDQRKYDKLPIFYALASTEPLNQLAPPALLQSLGLGESRIIRRSNATPDNAFDNALVESLTEKRWWQSAFSPISYFGESLFKARINFPDTLPNGNYTAEVYLFNRGKLLGFQTIPLTIYKTGFDASLANAAKHHGALYGLAAIFIALFGGWLGHRVFYRR